MQIAKEREITMQCTKTRSYAQNLLTFTCAVNSPIDRNWLSRLKDIMFDKLSFAIALLIGLAWCEPASAQFGSPDAKFGTTKRKSVDWTPLSFGRTLDSGEAYQIKKLVLTIPPNSKQEHFGPVKGLFVSDDALLELEVADRKRLERLEQSLKSFMRLEQHGGATSYGRSGKITVVTTDGEFVISVSELGFNLGDEHPSDDNTFYSWTLAKILDDEAQRVSKAGLKKKHFDVLSGQHWINSQRDRYPKLQQAKK